MWKQETEGKGTVSETDLACSKGWESPNAEGIYLTNKLLFQNAITHGMIKSTALGIALNSIKSPVTWVIILEQKILKVHILVKERWMIKQSWTAFPKSAA